MPLLSAEFKTNMAVKYEEAKIYARNAYKKATARTPKEPRETDDGSPKKSMSMKEAYFKRMEKGTLKDSDTNPHGPHGDGDAVGGCRSMGRQGDREALRGL